MKKTLITAAEVKKYFETNEKTIYVDAKSIITPAARDAANELGVEIVVGVKPTALTAKTACNDKSNSTFDPAFIANIVKTVIAQMNFQQPLLLIKEMDPSGLCLVRGNSVILEDCPADDSRGKVRRKEIFGDKEGSMLAGFIEIDAGSFSKQPKCNEICYLLEGSLTCEIAGTKYKGKAGDTFFIPAKRQIVYSTEDKAKLFFVACQ